MWFFSWADLVVRPRTEVSGQAFWARQSSGYWLSWLLKGTVTSFPPLIGWLHKEDQTHAQSLGFSHSAACTALVCRAGHAEARA